MNKTNISFKSYQKNLLFCILIPNSCDDYLSIKRMSRKWSCYKFPFRSALRIWPVVDNKVMRRMVMVLVLEVIHLTEHGYEYQWGVCFFLYPSFITIKKKRLKTFSSLHKVRNVAKRQVNLLLKNIIISIVIITHLLVQCDFLGPQTQHVQNSKLILSCERFLWGSRYINLI